MKFEDHLPEAIETILKATRDPDNAYNQPSTWYAVSETTEFLGEASSIRVNAPCHMALSLEYEYKSNTSKNDWKKPIILASNCQYAVDDEEQSLMYFDWIFSQESPWRRLIEEGFHLIRDPEDDRLRGFYFDQNRLKMFPFLLYKNFCVASRVAFEYPDHIRAWKFFVESGLSKTDAFIMASHIKIRNSKKNSVILEPYRSTGHHWPICPNNGDGGYFDYLAWTNGTPRPHYRNPNGCWTKKVSDGLYNTWYIKDHLKANSSNPDSNWDESIITLDVALKVFEKWKKDVS